MNWTQFVEVLLQIEKISSRNEMMEILAELLRKVGEEEINQVVNLLLGQLKPKYTRLEFNLAEKMVVRAIRQAQNEFEQKQIESLYKELGDLGEVAEKVLSKQKIANYVGIGEIYQELTKIAEDSGVGSQERKIGALAKLIGSISGVEAKYVVRIILGKLRLGFSDKTILDAISYMAKGSKEAKAELEAAYQIAPDVGEIARLIKQGGVEKLAAQIQVELGRPVIPALAQRLRSAKEMIGKMGEVQVEPKYDGTRVQIHFSKELESRNLPKESKQDGLFEEEKGFYVRSFTRNLDENTAMFPELMKIDKEINAMSVILDSEAVGYDPKTGKLVPFQLTITRKRKHETKRAAGEVPLRFFVFDILYKDGASLIEKPLNERRKILEGTIRGGEVLVVDDFIVTEQAEKLREYHAKQLKEGLEGVLVKKIDGQYLPGRQDWNWVKFKEVEGKTGKLIDTVDAVVMGYYMGKGKRQQFGMGAFLVGVADREKIVTIAKIGTGLSDKQFEEIFGKLSKVQSRQPSKNYQVAKTLKPDVWVEPQVVVEVAADEVTKSPLHTSGLALRFPRLIKIRDDKDWAGVTTLEELRDIGGF